MINLKNLSVAEKAEVRETFKKVGSSDLNVAAAASREVAQAIETPLREVLLSGDIVNGIFSPGDFMDGQPVEYPLDLITPGQESEFVAYVVPGEGRIPERRVEGDYLMIPTFSIGNSIDCGLRLIRDANWPVITRMMEILEAGFVKKMNDDGWQTILSAAVDRNILVNDPNATAGQFTPRLVSLMQSIMRRNGGGNSATLRRSKLTDLYVSPEAQADLRAWGLDLVADAVREQIFRTSDGSGDFINIFGVNIHDLDELGEGQEYQTYFTSTLGGSMAGGDLEICVGLDRQFDDSFVHPVKEALQIWEDNTLHRRNIFGLYGRFEGGWAVLDSRRTILGSM